MYQVQFKSSGIVAYSHQERGMCQYFIDCNDYGPDKVLIDLETSGSEGERIRYVKGDCLGLFKLVKTQKG